MKKLIGKVTEVFIPNEYKNKELLDIMDIDKIGFKVLIDNKIIEIIEKQNKNNSNIYKDDKVFIIEENNNISIKLYDGEKYE